ncbi:MAG: diaminopimelate epimerase [Bacteroidales bacterium]|nr:diaminopimelate epimerase [Bacteroidales bacterium]MBN2817746.1 diaminopimelate epimerase [Bacteroidales bacterium]
MNEFVKSHGLGNEYIVLDSENIDFELSKEMIMRLCNVHFGIGSDGILLKVPSVKADFGLRILNPDGSEAEKSGNGLRIFSKYLYDYKFTQSKIFSIETPGGLVYAHIIEESNAKANRIKVDMGRAIFKAKDIPVNSDEELFFDKKLKAGDREYIVNCVSVGNPHCVVVKDVLDPEEIKKYGPMLETHAMFPNRINVQFVKPVSDSEVEILIWERGAGYTLASGSSSSAVATVVRKKGLVGDNITVKMPGGQLHIEIDEYWDIKMTGEVKEIASGVLSEETIRG